MMTCALIDRNLLSGLLMYIYAVTTRFMKPLFGYLNCRLGFWPLEYIGAQEMVNRHSTGEYNALS